MTEEKSAVKHAGNGKENVASGAMFAGWETMMAARAKAIEGMIDSSRDFVAGVTKLNEDLMEFAESQVKNGAAKYQLVLESDDPTEALRINAELTRAAAQKSVETTEQILSLMTRMGGTSLLAIQDGARAMTRVAE